MKALTPGPGAYVISGFENQPSFPEFQTLYVLMITTKDMFPTSKCQMLHIDMLRRMYPAILLLLCVEAKVERIHSDPLSRKGIVRKCSNFPIEVVFSF